VSASLVRGRVVDEDGAPVAGASIYIVAAPVSVPDVALLTDDDGRFEIAVPSPGQYRFGIRAPDGPAFEHDVAVPTDRELLEINLPRS
jgi:hypothetical protein